MAASSFEFTPIYRWLASGAVLVILKFTVDRVFLVRTAFTKIRGSPGRVPLWFNPVGVIGFVLGNRFPLPGMVGYYAMKLSIYKKFEATSIACVRVFAAQPFFWVADAEAVNIITSDQHTFPKNVADYEFLNIYGKNLVSSEGSDWKRHRSVAMSAFNESNIALVWSETLRVTSEWFEHFNIEDATLDILPVMTKATSFIIASAGFGRRLSWTDESMAEPPPGCRLTFQSAVTNTTRNIIFKALTPGWFYQLSSLIKVPYLSSRALMTQLAFEDLRVHMLDLVSSARAEIMSGEHSVASGAALLRNLVEANMHQDGDSRNMSEGELLSNIFAFLLAGHETSTHTLCFAFSLLALYPDYQRKLYEEVTHAWPEDLPSTQLTMNHKEYIDKLKYTLAFIRETLRILPAEPCMPKDVHKDTALPGTYFDFGPDGCPFVATGKFSMAIPAGSMVVMDVWALHMNPLYWGKDAAEFKPERFLDCASYQWPRNAYLPFSGGARSCIGQRFALTEMVGILASVVRRYQVQVPDELAKRSFKEQKEVLLEWRTGITLTPVNTRVKLCRRS